MTKEMDSSALNLIRPEIAALSAYHVPDASGLIKLDAMENPYTWPTELKSKWLSVLHDAQINRYPDPSAARLRRKIRKNMSVPDGFEILLGNGSDELIQIILMAVAEKDRIVLAPKPSFVMYDMITKFVQMQYIDVPLNDDFSLDSDKFLTAIERHQPAVTFIAYPNNPTGNCFDESVICQALELSKGIVILDEAYHAFSSQSFMSKLPDYENLMVMRTVSKMGLAGLRLGFLAASPAWINELNKIRLPYNINILTQLSAEFALDNQDLLDQQTQQMVKDRESLFSELDKLNGVQVYPSEANFLMFRTESGQADRIFNKLKEYNVLIKNLSPGGGLLSDCLRVSIGTPDENRCFMDGLKEIL